jgi:hypothetical protein
MVGQVAEVLENSLTLADQGHLGKVMPVGPVVTQQTGERVVAEALEPPDNWAQFQ